MNRSLDSGAIARNGLLVTTGHSLGGGATLIAKRFAEQGFKPIEPDVHRNLYLWRTASQYGEISVRYTTIRFRNAGDFIPHLPKIMGVLVKRIPRLEGVLMRSSACSRRKQLIATLIQTSLQEHRAIKYVRRLNFGKLPSCPSLFGKIKGFF